MKGRAAGFAPIVSESGRPGGHPSSPLLGRILWVHMSSHSGGLTMT